MTAPSIDGLTPVPAAARPPLAALLGDDDVLRQQTIGVLSSSVTYLVYGGITAAQVAMDLMARPVALWLCVLGTAANLLFYALVRSGRVRTGRDPGLARTQLIFGIALMYPAYAAVGPAATGLLVVMASHVVYSMFMMTPRQVWQLVGVTLAGLVLTMLLCHRLWPERYVAAVQVSGLMYAALVMPLIAVLAHRITGMTQRLRAQHAELQIALARLQELATSDELTRTHNRRHMNELLRVQQAHHARHAAPLSLALIDIDLFKSVNDRHGHAAGDEVLRQFAAVLGQQLRGADLLARWGGEEFLVLMPSTACADARGVMDRLQADLARLSPQVMPLGLAISFSAGVTEVRPDEPVDAAVERADQAMYRAKTGGRARCVEG